MNVFVRVISLLLLEGIVFLSMTCEFVSKRANVCVCVCVCVCMCMFVVTFVSTSNYEASFSGQV